MQAICEELAAKGATLVAITPQLAEHSRTMIERHSLSFDLLSDPGNEYLSTLGLRFELPDDVKEVYLSIGIDLPKHHGEDSWTLPVPARLLVDSSGIIRAADIDVDYTRRPEPEKTLTDLDGL